MICKPGRFKVPFQTQNHIESLPSWDFIQASRFSSIIARLIPAFIVHIFLWLFRVSAAQMTGFSRVEQHFLSSYRFPASTLSLWLLLMWKPHSEWCFDLIWLFLDMKQVCFLSFNRHTQHIKRLFWLAHWHSLI